MTFLLDFPNNEVKRGFATAVATGYLQPKAMVLSDMAQMGTIDSWEEK